MGILPQLTPDLEEQLNDINKTSTQEIKELGRCFLIDFEKNEFVIKDGGLVEVDKLTGIKQWVQCIARTYKDKYQVYKDTGFYCNIDDLRGMKPSGFVLSELKREISEALVKHRYIKSISDFDTSYNKKELKISFTVNLIDGTSFSEVI